MLYRGLRGHAHFLFKFFKALHVFVFVNLLVAGVVVHMVLQNSSTLCISMHFSCKNNLMIMIKILISFDFYDRYYHKRKVFKTNTVKCGLSFFCLQFYGYEFVFSFKNN